MVEAVLSQLQAFADRVCKSPVRHLQSPGLEADDIIATLAVRALAEGCHVTIASPDKVSVCFTIGLHQFITSCWRHNLNTWLSSCSTLCRSLQKEQERQRCWPPCAGPWFALYCRTSSSCCGRGWTYCGRASPPRAQRAPGWRTTPRTPSASSSAWSHTR